MKFARSCKKLPETFWTEGIAFITEHFPGMFANSSNPKGKLFLQDWDPSQNSKAAIDAMDSINCRVFKIQPRSPDLNPI